MSKRGKRGKRGFDALVEANRRANKELAEILGKEHLWQIPDYMPQLEAENAELRDKLERAEAALRSAQDALDRLMGDSDLDEDDSVEYLAAQEVATALAALRDPEDDR